MAQENSPKEQAAPYWVLAVQLLALLVFIAIRLAEPVGDGDLFWQMAYGKYMLANHTLVPDHTIYSWTPADNPYIYCSWFAEISLYLMYQLGGLPLLFAFRYAVVLFSVGLAFHYAWLVGWQRRAEFWCMITWFVSASYVGTILKPELFSLGFMSMLAYLVFRFRLAAEREEPLARYLFGMVAVMVLWANSHGVFFFGLIAVGLYALGEILNGLLSPGLALPRAARLPLLAGVVGCGLAAFCTPYHYHFVAQLIEEMLGIVLSTQSAGDKAAYSSLAAHLPIWKALAFHFHEYLAMGVTLGAVVFTWLLWRGGLPASPIRFPYALLTGSMALGSALYLGLSLSGGAGLLVLVLAATWLVAYSPARGKIDFPYLLLNGAFALIFTVYLRATFYWPVFFIYSTLYLLHVLRKNPNYRPESAQLDSFSDFLFCIVNLGFLRFYYGNVDVLSIYLRIEPADAVKWVTLGGMAVQTIVIAAYTSWRVGLSDSTTGEDGPLGGDPEIPPSGPAVGFLEARHWLTTLAVMAQLFLCINNSREAITVPYASSWFGFGITYWNPVDEVEFLKKYHPDIKTIINDYDSGGYLIWALYPKTKVLIDPRSFPYRKFWADYIAYEHGQIGLEFLDRFKEKPDVCLVSLKNMSLWRSYLKDQKHWVPAWIGTAYVIFVKRGFVYPPDAVNFLPGRFETLRNGQKAFQIFQFGIESNLLDVSWTVLDVMKRKFNSTPNEKLLVENLQAYKDTMVALKDNQLDEAIVAQEKCLAIGQLFNANLLMQMYQFRLSRIKKAGKSEADPLYQETLHKAQDLMGQVRARQ